MRGAPECCHLMIFGDEKASKSSKMRPLAGSLQYSIPRQYLHNAGGRYIPPRVALTPHSHYLCPPKLRGPFSDLENALGLLVRHISISLMIRCHPIRARITSGHLTPFPYCAPCSNFSIDGLPLRPRYHSVTAAHSANPRTALARLSSQPDP